LLRKERKKKNFDVLNSATSEFLTWHYSKRQKSFLINLFIIIIFWLIREGKKTNFFEQCHVKIFYVVLFKTSKKLIIIFFDVLIFAMSKNFDVAFLTKVLKRQKVAIFL
jgi:hypothetical protein